MSVRDLYVQGTSFVLVGSPFFKTSVTVLRDILGGRVSHNSFLLNEYWTLLVVFSKLFVKIWTFKHLFFFSCSGFGAFLKAMLFTTYGVFYTSTIV